jgi:cell division protein FtsA
MSRSITGIDIGSTYIKVAAASETQDGGGLAVRALARVESDGIKNGNVINQEAAGGALAEALHEAEKVLGERIRRAHVAVGGTGLGTVTDISTVAISRADSTASEFDVARALEEGEARLKERANLRLIHTVPSEFKIDGRKVIGKPHGYVGNKLELRTVYITSLSPSLDSLVGTVENAGVEVESVYASPVAESIATLTATSRNAGCALVNIGGETVSILTHEDGLPTSLKVFPIGGAHITHDIALGLRIPLDEAERLKVGGSEDKRNAKRIQEIIDARLSDIFELIDTHLKKIGRSGLLPAGITFTGGGAHTRGIEELARKQLGLPAKIGHAIFGESKRELDSGRGRDGLRNRERAERAREAEWTTAIGLCMLGLSFGEPEESLGLRVAKRTKSGLISFIRQFLP